MSSRDTGTDRFDLLHGDCLERMKEIPAGSVDMVLTDPPYGTTACKWDAVIPFAPMWEQLKRLCKKNRAIVMTASQPFTSALVMSNVKMFKYDWIWRKSRSTGFQDVSYRPLKEHETVLVFSEGGCSTGSKHPVPYTPQGLVACCKARTEKKAGGFFRSDCGGGGVQKFTNWPKTVLDVGSETGTVHPTQKPVALMEYLIKTYTNEGETVLDFTMGSGTTGVACMNTGRDFIGIEMDDNYFDTAASRIAEAYLTALEGGAQ